VCGEVEHHGGTCLELEHLAVETGSKQTKSADADSTIPTVSLHQQISFPWVQF